MPKDKKVTEMIPRMYKWNFENIGLFFFIKAQKLIVPTITITQAITNYFRFMGINNWDYECARTTYERLQKEFLNGLKSETPKKNI